MRFLIFSLLCVLPPSSALAADPAPTEESAVVKAIRDSGAQVDPDAYRNPVLAALAMMQHAPSEPEKFDAFMAGLEQKNPGIGHILAYIGTKNLAAQILSGTPPANPDVHAPAEEAAAKPEHSNVPHDQPAPQHGGEPPLPPGYSLGIRLAQHDVKANPDDASSKVSAGSLYYAAHDYRPAYDLLDKAIQQGDKDPNLLVMYAGAAYHLGDYQTAAAAAKQALEYDPSNQEALALYHFSKNLPPKIRLPTSLGELAAARSPESLPGGLPAGAGPGTFQGPPPSGMTAEQAAALARQAAAPGSDAPARSMEFTKDAANAMRVRDYPTAYQLASQAITLNPQNAQALNFRAMTLSQMRRYSDAVQDASAALGLAPGSAAVLHTRSWAFSKQGKYKEGLQDAQSASAAEPSNAFLYQDKALALAGLGDRQGALDALRRSAELDPRFTARLERAVQLPQDADMTLLFDDGATAAVAPAPPAPGSRRRRFLRLAVLSTVGGLLIALGVLHIVSASWRDRMRMTVRRVLGPSPAVAAAAPVADSPSRGTFWTQYQVIKEIGLGGMGVVYEATDRSLERRVAVKKMRDEIRLEPDDRRRFVNEARLVAQLHHPNIVDIYGIVEDGVDVYLVFEFVEGRTLHDALKSGGPMELPRARRVVKEMADAVQHAHERSIIHRDLKPSNVMLTPEGRVKVMDFGIARLAKDALTRHSMTNTIAGTPPYMAPEQEQGTVRKESDVYALGVCLYEMTTGFLPFTGTGAAMLLNKLNGKLIPACQRNPALPAGFDAVVARALEPDPDKRYRTPTELVAALDALAQPARAA